MTSSTIAVTGALSVARKLRAAANNGDAGRAGEVVAAHGPDVSRSGAAGSGAAKAERTRPGAPLVARVVWLALLVCALVIACDEAKASYTFNLNTGLTPCQTITVSGMACSTVRTAIQNCFVSNGQSDYTMDQCTSDPVVNGTTISDTSPSASWQVSNVQQQGSSVICIPASKTIAPCPSGYAPNQITIQTTEQPDPYQNTFDSMPLQEMLYALCIGIAGLLGFSVGARLV